MKTLPVFAGDFQQDHLSGDLPFIHVHQEHLGSKVEYIGEISSNAIFRLRHRIIDAEVTEPFKNHPDGESEICPVSCVQYNGRSIPIDDSSAPLEAAHNPKGAWHSGSGKYFSSIESEYEDQLRQEHYRPVQNVV